MDKRPEQNGERHHFAAPPLSPPRSLPVRSPGSTAGLSIGSAFPGAWSTVRSAPASWSCSRLASTLPVSPHRPTTILTSGKRARNFLHR